MGPDSLRANERAARMTARVVLPGGPVPRQEQFGSEDRVLGGPMRHGLGCGRGRALNSP
jgi:hypothetical protein